MKTENESFKDKIDDSILRAENKMDSIEHFLDTWTKALKITAKTLEKKVYSNYSKSENKMDSIKNTLETKMD